MAVEELKKTLVLGHRNPDTDSICSAICYAGFKHQLTGENYEPCRAGNVNPETQYVLDYFKLKAPRLVENVKTQVKDIEIRKTKGVSRGISLKNAWGLMQENNVVTLPCVTEEGLLEGVITIGDITKSYMNLYDSSIISKACTKYANILDTLEGSMVVGDSEAYFDRGKVLIAAANPDLMENYIEKHDLVILGNRYESQLCAIEMEAGCIIVCEGAGVSLTIRKLAQERGCAVITTPYDTYTTARLINQSMPISYFMTKENIIEFSEEDYLDDIREIMASKRHRDFPILDSDGKYIGMISRRNLLGAKGKSIILVDHNEKSQAVEGMESADIREIIDHHRLASELPYPPLISYIEPAASSASELVAEILEQVMPTGEISKECADLMLAGMLLDTDQFTRNTGVRTFSAALYLRGEGADPADAKRLFRSSLDDFMREAKFQSNVVIYRSVIAITYRDSDGTGYADCIAAAKAANKLLMLDGVAASFALVRVGEKVHVSARSQGEINVQLILEKLNGGGHFDAAAAQISGVSMAKTMEMLRDAIDAYLDA